MYFLQGSKHKIIKIMLISMLKLYSCEMESKVVGGKYSTIKEFPHAVFIEVFCRSMSWVCGASILNQKLILTAGHCLYGCQNMSWDSINAFAGSEDFTAKTAYCRTVDKVRVHAGFNEHTIENDIGLARVKRNFILGLYVKKLILPYHFPHTFHGNVAGWGYTSDTYPHKSKRLMSVSQSIRAYNTCRRIYGFTKGMLCAGNNDNSHPARGDSGSALVTADFGQMAMGIVSYVDRDYPTLIVYTNLSYHYNWLFVNSKTLYCSF